MHAPRRNQRPEFPLPLVPEPRAKVHEIVSAGCGVPHADPLIVARGDDLVGTGRPLHRGDGAGVCAGIEVEKLRTGAETRGGGFANHTGSVVGVERGEYSVGAADVVEQDAAVGRAGGEDVGCARGPGDCVDCAVGAGQAVRG